MELEEELDDGGLEDELLPGGARPQRRVLVRLEHRDQLLWQVDVDERPEKIEPGCVRWKSRNLYLDAMGIYHVSTVSASVVSRTTRLVSSGGKGAFDRTGHSSFNA